MLGENWVVPQDSNLTCRDCKQGFVFTAGEQSFFTERNFGPPVRCKACRDVRKASAPKPAPQQTPREQVVQRVAERYQAPREPQQRRGYDARPQRLEDEQPAKFDRHASKRRKHRHERDDDDYSGG